MTHQLPDRGSSGAPFGHESQSRPGPGPTVRSLAIARIARGLSVNDLADLLGVIPNTIHTWESGRRIPPTPQVEAYADVLGLRLAVLPKEAL